MGAGGRARLSDSECSTNLQTRNACLPLPACCRGADWMYCVQVTAGEFWRSVPEHYRGNCRQARC